MSDQKAQIIGELQRKGKRITGQRKILLDVILEGKWSSCKEIYYMASKKDPTIGLATVYRMVGVLEEMGFLSRGYRYSYPVGDLSWDEMKKYDLPLPLPVSCHKPSILRIFSFHPRKDLPDFLYIHQVQLFSSVCLLCM